MLKAIFLVFVLLLVPALARAGERYGVQARKEALRQIGLRFRWHDPNRDGNIEIRWAKDLDIDADPAAAAGSVLVLADPRLLPDLLPSLNTLPQTWRGKAGAFPPSP